jgi:hypothetical protein
MPLARPLSAAILCATFSGCITPWNTKMPQWHMSSAEWQQREAQNQDPFPDSDIGPDTGVRPRGYNQQRSDPLRTKIKSEDTRIRLQVAPPPGATNGIGAQYPEAVQVQ